MSTDSLSLSGERAWLRTRTHLENSDGFALFFIFNAHPAVISIFSKRLEQIHQLRISGLNRISFQLPEQLSTEVLSRLLHPYLSEQATTAPFWLDLSMQNGEEWHKARLNLLTRLNEQREPLRANLNRPLILVLPAGERKRVKELAPDLWAIRDFTLDTEDGFVVLPVEEVRQEPPVTQGSFALAPAEESYLAEWRRLMDLIPDTTKTRLSRGVFLAGERAYQALMRVRRLEEARVIAEYLLEYARIRVRQEDTLESLRDLLMSLDTVADILLVQGHVASAKHLLEEALAIGKQLSTKFPSHNDYKDLESRYRARLETLDNTPT